VLRKQMTVRSSPDCEAAKGGGSKEINIIRKKYCQVFDNKNYCYKILINSSFSMLIMHNRSSL